MVLYTLKLVKRIDLVSTKKRNTGKILEVMDMLSALVVIMTSQVNTYVQIDQELFIKHV